ncbi:MAG: hypothetical protein JKY65_30400 [Planctomycetes bacterium]|nr:hypothetical protein [Planctomycetota bacterium]
MIDDLIWRLPVLALFLVGMLVYDRWRHGAEGKRAAEYGLLLACGLVGAGVGFTQDQISIRVSPDYFVYGKGIERGPNFERDVSFLGTYAGLVAGMVLGGCLLLTNQPRKTRAQHTSRALFRLAVPRTLVPALLFVPLGLLIAPHTPLRDQIGRNLLSPEETERFLLVWGMHIGLYAGAALGLAWALIASWRRRAVIEAAEVEPTSSDPD